METEHLQKPASKPQFLTRWAIFPDLRHLNHAYWFRLILTEDETTTELRYKVLIRFLKKQTQESAIVSIDRVSDVYINDELPDLPVDRLAYESGKVFYPVIMEIDEKMNLLGIRNHEQIVSRWEKIQPDLRRYFTGDEANRYLNRMDEMIMSAKNLEALFEKELFIRFYFYTAYMNYTHQFEIRTEVAFPIGNYAPVLFDVKNRLLNVLNKDGFKEITQEGIEVRKTFGPDLEKEGKNTYSAHFVLNAGTNILREAKAEWNFRSPFQKKIQLILFPLRQAVSSIPIVEQENKWDENKNKGFFSRIFGI